VGPGGAPASGPHFPMPSESKMSSQFQTLASDAYRGNAPRYMGDYETFKALYAHLSAQVGKPGDDAGIVNSDRATAAFNQLTGGLVNVNGHAQTLPSGIDSGQFSDALSRRIQALDARGLLAPGFTTDAVSRLPLKEVGDGRYQFQAGNSIVLDKNGQPLTVDLHAPVYDFDMDKIRNPGQPHVLGSGIKNKGGLPIYAPNETVTVQ
jgi:hypothetical protein